MARSKGTIVSVKVPIKWEIMTTRQRTRLSHITSRDTRVIRAYLGVIARHEDTLIVGKKRKRIHAGRLDNLTLTTIRHKEPTKRRLTVSHDFKKRFPNISQNELQECRDLAIAMWNSYLERGGSPPLKSKNGIEKKIPRNFFKGRFKLVHRADLAIKYWLEVRDSLDSARQGRIVHDKLTVPLKTSPYHISQFRLGEVKSCRIVKDGQRKWWVVFAVKVSSENQVLPSQSKPLAVMGIDLGISKAACAAILTKNGIIKTRYFHQPEKEKYLEKYEKRIASLQREMRIRQNQGLSCDKITKKLRELSRKRKIVNEEWDRVLVRRLVDFALEVSAQYNLYVTIGNPKGIRGIAMKAYSSGRKYRKMIHRWAFSRIILMLGHSFSKLGWSTGNLGSRFFAVYEGRTSIYCHRCGRKGVRPKQSLFVCHTCGCRMNADMNGAINIARRMIRLTPELRDEHQGLGRWLLPHEKKRLRPKAARSPKRGTKRKSRLSEGSPAPSKGESAVVRTVQKDLLSFGDEAVMSDKDPAVESAAENLSASKCLGTLGPGALSVDKQQKEATFRERNHVPVTSDNTRATLEYSSTTEVSDDNYELGRTQELQAKSEVHSPSHRRARTA